MTLPSDSDPKKVLNQIVQDFLDAQLQGQDPDIEEIIRAHPELEHQIRRRLNSLQEVDGLFAGLVEQGNEDPVTAALEYDMIGQQLGDFEILKLIGRGGMGVVFLARQISLDREVALKVIAEVGGGQSKTLERFKREATVLAKLSHAHIVPIYEVGQQGPYAYFAMEYVQGVSLDSILTAVREAESTEKASELVHTFLQQPVEQDRPTQSDETSVQVGAQIDRDYIVTISKIMLDVLAALQYAHEQGVLHRDVKPSNILIDATGAAKLVDFGLARAQSHPSITVTGEFFGTPNYVSPEQIRDPESVNHRSDLYSLAATYYECLTLRRPFQADTVNETLTNVLAREIVPPRRHSPRLAPDLNTVLLHALEKQPQDRYQSAVDFAIDIQNVLDFKPIRAKRAGPATRACRAMHRNKLKMAFSFIVIAAILLGIALYRESMKETARKQASEIRRLLDDADLLLCQAALNGHVSSVLAAGPLVDRAVKNYSEVLKMDSRNWWALTQRGVARLIVGTDKKEVIRDFEQAERLKPGFAPLENLKTLALDRPDEKIQRIQQPTLQNLDAREAFTYGILVSQERPRAWQKDCVDLFTLCVDKEPEYLPSQVARARVRSHTEGNLDECRTLLRSKPNCAFLHLMVARLLGPWRLGKSVEAVAESVTEHEMAVQLQPWNPVCHVGLADVYGRTGNLAGAETHLKTACLLDSTAISYLDLARFYSRQQDHPRTLAACGEGLKKKHDLHCESEILEIKASCLRQLGRIEELPPCLEQWEQCLRSLAGTPPTSWNTNDMGSYYHERLLEFLWNNGRRQEARILVTDSDETHPQYQLDLGNTLCQLYGSEGDFTNAMLLSDQLFEQIMESEILDTSSEFHEAYEIITRHPRYQLILGADRSQAMSTWETILARFPENSRLWSFYGQFLERNGGHVKAVVVAFRQALRYMSNEKQRRQTSFFLAGVLQRAGNLPAAEEELRALVYKIENTSQTDIVESSIARDIYITLSNVYWAQDRTDLAIAVLEQGLKGVPSQPRLIKELAKKRALTGSTSEAIATYMSYFRALPQDLSTSGDNLVDSSLESDAAGEAMFDLTNLLLQIGNLDEAEKFLRREQQLDRKVPSTDSLSQSPNYVTYRHISWAKVYLAKGNTISALSELDSAGKLKPKSFYVWMLIANVCLSSSQWEKAQEAAKRMTELDPSSQIAHTFTGFFSQNVGDHQGAVQAFRRALTLTPDGPQKASIYMGLSLSLRSLDQLQDARNACRMATEADPNNWGVWGGLGAGCKMLHEYPESINSYERAIALAPDNPALIACYSELAALYATCPESGLRNGRKAVQLATQACEWSGHKDHRPIAALAAAYAECGDFPRAMQYQDEAISLLRGSQYSGIGVALTKADGVYTITGIGPNTPAASANIYVGDIVTAVDGQSIQGMKLTDVVDRIKGTPSTKVTLTMKHADRETAEDISILRQPITNPDLQEYEKRLREYRAGKPWREKEQ